MQLNMLPIRQYHISFTLLLSVVLSSILIQLSNATQRLTLTTSESSSVTGVEHFGTDLECRVSTCLSSKSDLEWYKGNDLIARGLQVLIHADRYRIRHNVFLNHSQDCSGDCSDSEQCPAGRHCLDVICCQCSGEEFTLILTSLNASDSDSFTCKLQNSRAKLDYELEVIASGLEDGWHQNFTYDHSECCHKKGIPDTCLGPCNVGKFSLASYDPVKCEGHLQPFLNCVTEGGNVSHLYCCRQEFVPPFCWDFCHGVVGGLKVSHRLCIYWLTEILSCYERAYLPFPSEPQELMVRSRNKDELEACWKPPLEPEGRILNYTVHYRAVPRFPFTGRGLPFIPTDEDLELTPSMPGWQDGQDSGPMPDDDDSDPTIALRPLQLPRNDKRSHRVPRDQEQSEGFFRNTEEIFEYKQRKKRQAILVFTTPRFTISDNETEVAELLYQKLNTTDTCITLKKLKPSTEYSVFVTATNEYGSSLPSIRSIAATQAEIVTNSEYPDVQKCCRANEVNPLCIPKVCDLKRAPSAVGAFDIALNCRSEFVRVSPCLADGRDHTPCCRKQGVRDECLRICNGTATYIGFDSIFCLTLDMNAVFQCIRDGYGTHPSPPMNVTIKDISMTSAVIAWSPPNVHNEKVQNYSLFYKEDNYMHSYSEVKNAKSPHLLLDLKPGTPYLVYLIAHGTDGSSLRSTIEGFFTLPETQSVCPFGDPLLSPTGSVIHCKLTDGPDDRFSCPRHFECIAAENTDGSYCCPRMEHIIEPPDGPFPFPIAPPTRNLTQCCKNYNMTDKCAKLCSYHTQISDLVEHGPKCWQHVEAWVSCAADGRDHRPCCAESGVPKQCQLFCYPSEIDLKYSHITCIAYVDEMLTCGREGVLKLPGPPKRLHLFYMGPNVVTLKWDKPSQPIDITTFQVQLFSKDEPRPIKEVNSTARVLNLTGLVPSTEYTANVHSINDHGVSIPSNNVTFILPDEEHLQEDRKIKPTSPRDLELAWKRGSSVNVTWKWDGKSLSGKSLSDVIFHVNYRAVFSDDTKKPTGGAVGLLMTPDKYAVISGLELDSQYDVWVEAVNKKTATTSLPSEIISVVPEENLTGPHVEIVFMPKKPFYVEGETVNVTCISTGTPPPKVDIMGEKRSGDYFGIPNPFAPSFKHLANGKGAASHKIEPVTADLHQMQYECVAKYPNDVVKRAVARLLVEFTPFVKSLTPNENVIAPASTTLSCRIKAYPAPSVTWTHTKPGSKSKNIEQDNHFFASVVEDDPMNGVYIAELAIRAVRDPYAGSYMCEACNRHGCGVAKSNVTVVTSPKPLSPDHVKDCCKKQGVKDQCSAPCKFDIDISVMNTDVECDKDVTKLIQCAKDGYDHRDCCIAHGVFDGCLPMCSGKPVTYSQHQFVPESSCFEFSKAIISCLQQKHDLVPDAPDNLQLKSVGKGMLKVSWDSFGDHANYVESFYVFYKEVGKPTWELQNTTKQVIVLRGLRPGARYNFTVMAANHHGSSKFAPQQTIKIQGRLKPGVKTVDTSKGKPAASTKKKSISKTGLIIGVVLVLLFLLAAIFLVAWIRRNPRGSRLRPRLQSIFARGSVSSAGSPPQSESVSFENPSYGEGKVHGLPGDTNGNAGNPEESTSEPDNATGWQSPILEAPEDSKQSSQKGMKYAQLT